MKGGDQQGFSQDFRIGVQKFKFGMNWVSNSFSSHCIVYKNIWILGCPIPFHPDGIVGLQKNI